MEKVDGMLGTLIYKQDIEPVFTTTTNKKIYDIPVINEYKNILEAMKIKEAKIPGELIAIKRGNLLPFNQSQSIVKRFKEDQNKGLIYHYPLDIISFNQNKVDFKQAWSIVSKLFRNRKHIKLPKVVRGDLETFRAFYRKTMENPGFDGVVARDINGKNYKVKFIESVDLVVIGAGNYQLPSWPRKQISYLLTSFIDKNGIFRTSSKIGTGFKISERSKFYQFVMDNKLYEKKGDIFIKPKLMIEVQYFRSRITDTPSFIFSSNEYKEKGDRKSITFSHPSFIRERPDKIVNKLNARLEQIPDFSY
jgi:ATP-dependent DNA ligase